MQQATENRLMEIVEDAMDTVRYLSHTKFIETRSDIYQSGAIVFHTN